MDRSAYDGRSNADGLNHSLALEMTYSSQQNIQRDEKHIDDDINEIGSVVAALNFGNTYSGYAFSTKSKFEKDPLNISINEPEHCMGRPFFGKRISTCILFDSKKDLISFGYEAEREWFDFEETERKSCFFFRHLWDILTSDKIIGMKSDVLAIANLKIWRFLKALIDDCETSLENVGKVKRWVITVPADLTDTAENFLKDCIQQAGIPLNQLRLVTEAEASFAYCQKLLQSEKYSKLEDSTEYMIVDLGDYDADLRVVKKVCGELREKYRQTRSKCTKSIYEQFLEILCKIIGKKGIDILKKDPLACLEIERGLEEVKLPTLGKKQIFVPLHQSTLEELRKLPVENNSKIKITNTNMILQEHTFKKIFSKSIVQVTSQMERVFEVYNEANKISYIILTGDFYQCCLVKENVEIKFPQKRIICSAFKEETVVKGAVLCGLQPYTHTFELLRAYDKPAEQTGFVLIINFLFDGSETQRTGSMEDVNQLQAFFAKYNYVVRCHSDMSSDELKLTLKRVRDDVLVSNGHKYHSFICIIMSHGNQQGVNTTTDTLPVEKIVSPFKNDKAKSFIGKPKIFLVQACRGGYEQHLNKYETPDKTVKTDYMEASRTPTDADIITIYATTPGYVSIRFTHSSKRIGAWFIHAFITAAEKYPNNHLLEILTAVNYELANNPEYVYEDGKKGQMSMSEVTLTKLFYF